MTSEELTPLPDERRTGLPATTRRPPRASGVSRGRGLAAALENLREAGGMGAIPLPSRSARGDSDPEGAGRSTEPFGPLVSPPSASTVIMEGRPAEAGPPVAEPVVELVAEPVAEPVAELIAEPVPSSASARPAAVADSATEPDAPVAAGPEADLEVKAQGHDDALIPKRPSDDARSAVSAARRKRARAAGGGLDNTLTATIRRWAKATTPKELEARGVKRVRSVSMSRIAALIEKAINRELIARTLEGDADDATSLSANARAGFLELARSEMSGEVDAQAESSAFANMGRLRAELDARRTELEARERRLEMRDLSVEDHSLERRLRQTFASRSGEFDPALESEVVRVALEELSGMRSRALEDRRAEGRRESQRLERRIAKLAGLLEQTEGELRRTRSRQAEDPGLASIFAEVQGLDSEDERFGQKRDLMKGIFEANLALQR